MAVVLSSLSLTVLMWGDCWGRKEEGELSPASKASGKELEDGELVRKTPEPKELRVTLLLEGCCRAAGPPRSASAW